MHARSWVVLGSMMVGLLAPAHADKRNTVYAVDDTSLHARPHNAAPSLSRAARGARLKVVGSRGRWLRVRLGKSVGWVTRSRVSAREPDAAVKRTARSGFSRKPKTDARRTPDEVPTSELATTDVSQPDPARFGGTLLTTAGAQTFAMRQVGEVEAMSIASGQVATVSAGARMRVLRDGWVGLGGNLDLGTANLVYYSTTEQSQPIRTRQVVVDAYAEVGWGQRWYVAARGGYHHASLSVESDRAEPMLLGEQIAGLTAGLGGGMGITSRVSLAVSVDAMPAGTQHWESVPGTLETTSVRGAWGRTQLAVRLLSHLVAAVSYRATVVASPTRTDQAHAVTAGVGVTW